MEVPKYASRPTHTLKQPSWQTRSRHACRLRFCSKVGPVHRPPSQSKLPRGLRGSLRSSTPSFDPSRLLARAFSRTTLFGRKQHPPTKEPDPPVDDGTGDFELIASDDVPPLPTTDSHVPASSHNCPDHCESAPAPRAKSNLFRLKNISKVSIHLSSFTDSRASSSRTRTATSESDICLAFPKPPTHIPTPDPSAPPSDSATQPRTSSSSVEHDNVSAGSTSLADQEEPDSNIVLGPSPVNVWRSVKSARPRHRFPSSLTRFRPLSQILRDSFASHPIDASSVVTLRSERRNCVPDFDSNSAFSDPSNSLKPAPPSSSFTPGHIKTEGSPTASIASLPEQPSPPPVFLPPLRRKHSAPAGLSRDPTYYPLVNPSELTASPPSLTRSSFVNSSARSSFLPPSPSWLSRNVTQSDPAEISAAFPSSRISALTDSVQLKFPEITSFYPSALFAPDSPYPLPIPPPLVLVPPPRTRQPTVSPSRPILYPLRTDVYPESPESDSGSFVTSPTPLDSALHSPASSTTPTTAFASALPSPSPQFRRRLSNISQISVERHRQSIARLKKSRTASSPRTHRQPSCKASKASVNKARRQLSNGPKFHLIKAPPSPVSSQDQPSIFIPAKQPEFKQSPLPKHLSLLLEAFFIQSGILNSFSRPEMDYTGKNLEVVDFGGEVDYSGHQWFQEPPPRPEPPQVVQPFVPDDEVIKQNEAFDFALKAAPNVLYGRFKQYGQLGVLAWCSEFGEMIDSLKELGFSGNMFVSTRSQALRTCEEILKLKLDIKMKIIIMYLSSQVGRLRRFLDSGERQWEDYPDPGFPILVT